MSELSLGRIARAGLLARKELETAKAEARAAGDDWMAGMFDAAVTLIEAAVGVVELGAGQCKVCGDLATHLDEMGEPACDVCGSTFLELGDGETRTDTDEHGAVKAVGFDPIALGN